MVVGGEELAGCLSAVDPGAEIFHGASPGRDNDGVHAVTVTVPDRDGVIRSHPH